MMQIITKILVIFLVLLTNLSVQAATYYKVFLGSPYNYPMDFDLGGNYFFDQNNKIFYAFVSKKTDTYWGNGIATIGLEGSKGTSLPYGVHLQWFSTAENQFWQGQYIFDQTQLEALMKRKINDVFKNKQTVLGEQVFYFKFYVVPDGLVTIWLYSNSEQYFIGQFKATRMQQEPDWPVFYKRALANLYGKEIQARDTFIKNRLNDNLHYVQKKLNGVVDKFDTDQQDKLLTANPWLALNKTYHWQFEVGERPVKLKDFWVYYANGEALFTYEAAKQLAVVKPIPFTIEFVLEDNRDHSLKTMYINFDPSETKEVFDKLSDLSPKSAPLKIYIKLMADIKDTSVYVVKGTKRVELTKVSGNIESTKENDKITTN